MLIAFGACLAWATGTIYAKHKPSKTNVITNAAVQLTMGGLTLLLMGIIFEDFKSINTASTASIYSLIYLIIIGSVIAYSCFVYAIKQLPIGLSSIYAYINPFIALMLGFLFLDEKITAITSLALISALGGIYWINKGYQKQKILAKG